MDERFVFRVSSKLVLNLSHSESEGPYRNLGRASLGNFVSVQKYRTRRPREWKGRAD